MTEAMMKAHPLTVCSCALTNVDLTSHIAKPCLLGGFGVDSTLDWAAHKAFEGTIHPSSHSWLKCLSNK